MEQLSTADQGKVDELNDAIRRLTLENKEAFSARMNLEATKNKLENLLTNNLIRFVHRSFDSLCKVTEFKPLKIIY